MEHQSWDPRSRSVCRWGRHASKGATWCCVDASVQAHTRHPRAREAGPQKCLHPTPRYRAGDQGQTPGSEFKSCPAPTQPRTCFWTRQPACFRRVFFFSIVNCFETMTDVLWLLNESTGPWTDVNGYKAPKHRAVVREGVMGPREVVQTWRRSRNRSPPRSRAVWVADLRSLTPTCALPSHRHGQLRGRRETPERLPRRGRCHPRPAHLQLSAAAGDLVSGRPQDPAQQPHVSVPLPDPQGRV